MTRLSNQTDATTGSPVLKPPAPGTRVSVATRNILTVLAGIIALVCVGGLVLYGPIVYGDVIENFGIVMMMTAPVITAVTFRVALDSWLDNR